MPRSYRYHRYHRTFSPTTAKPDAAPPDSGVRALVWLDMDPLLQAERLRCEKASRDLDRAKQELERFRSEWEPAFSRWFHGRFGEKLTQIRELESQASRLERIVEAVRMETLVTGCPERVAYERIQRMSDGAEKREEMHSKTQADESCSPGEGSEASEDPEEFPPEVEEFLKMGFEQLFGRNRFSPEEYAQMFEGFKKSFREDMFGAKRGSGRGSAGDDAEQEAFGRSGRRRQKAASAEAESPPLRESPEDGRRKRLFRDLARSLHPDLNADLTAHERDLWHEVAAAYESKDLDRLETLAAIVESGSAAGYSKIRSVSRLRSIFQEFQNKLKAAKKALRHAKKEPSWRFSETEANPDRLRALSKRLGWEFSEAIEELEGEVAYYAHKIERWKAPPTPRGRRREPVPRPAQQASRPRSAAKGSGGVTKAEMDAYTGFGS